MDVIPLGGEIVSGDVSLNHRPVIKLDSTSLSPNELRKLVKTLRNYGKGQFHAGSLQNAYFFFITHCLNSLHLNFFMCSTI